MVVKGVLRGVDSLYECSSVTAIDKSSEIPPFIDIELCGGADTGLHLMLPEQATAVYIMNEDGQTVQTYRLGEVTEAPINIETSIDTGSSESDEAGNDDVDTSSDVTDIDDSVVDDSSVSPSPEMDN